MQAKLNIRIITKTFTKQYSQFYCGLACLASVVKFYGGEITQEKLREESGTTFNGTSMLGLYQAAQNHGFDAAGFEAEIKNLKELKKPVILHVVKDEKLEHFVVCYGYEKGRFIIGDPASGIEYYSQSQLKKIWKTKTLLTLKPNNGFITQRKESKSKRVWFLQLLRSDFPILGIAAFLGLIISVLGLATAIFSQKLIDQILPEKDVRSLVIGIVVFTIILLSRAIVSYVRSIFLVRQSKEMNSRLINNFFGKLLFLPKSFFDSTSTGDMIARMNDASRIQKVVVFLSSQIVIDVLVILVSSVYIFVYSVSTGLISLLAIPVFGLLAWKYNKKVIDAQREVMQGYAATESKYIDSISGINTIKTFNRESLFAKVVDSIYGFFMQKVYVLGLLGAKINLWISLGSALLLAGIVSWTSGLVLSEQLMLGQMMAIITLIGSLGTSVVSVAMANIQLQEARIAFDRMYEFAAATPEYELALAESKRSESFQIDKLEIKNVNFRFPGKSLLLKNINIEVSKRQIITLFGEIGCGKSTLLAILQRFHSIESGGVFVNGDSWKEHPTEYWRRNIAVVEQHVQLFNGTVLENIALTSNPDVKGVVQFCQKFGFHEFISGFQQGYATIINENSTNLSGGQRQLIAIARALYNQPKILLLDEATAAMGRMTEKFVIKLLNKIKAEIPVIFVTHRPQLARYTDKIYVIENNTISASGKHEELVRSNEFYRQAFEELILA